MDPSSKEKYRPNLDTVLEVPHKITVLKVPRKNTTKLWNRMKSLMNPRALSPDVIDEPDGRALTSLLRVIGAPLDRNLILGQWDAGAQYIVKQYVAALGGEKALSSMDSLCATGKVQITVSNGTKGSLKSIGGGGGVGGHGNDGMPGFVLWKKRELWCLEVMLSTGYKVSTGSDGKAPLPWHHSYAYRVPPLPLGHLLQGLNPRSTANLFRNSACFEDKPINKEDCFILKLKVEPSTLSSSNVEIVRTVLGYFSHKTGLLVKLKDSRQLRMTAFGKHSYWESTMESYFQDYRTIDGLNIAHGGRTCVSLCGESSEGHARRRIVKLVWALEEVGFDIKGLSVECFLPPGDLKKEEESCGMVKSKSCAKLTSRIPSPLRFQATKVVPIDDSNHDLEGSDISDLEDLQDFESCNSSDHDDSDQSNS
ncbi:hypothetical protein ABKV19_024121 [Rosa sericea]